jgi:hypothetical protein
MGFETVEDECAEAVPLSENKPGLIDIYMVDAAIGLPKAWESAMMRYSSFEPQQQQMLRLASRRPSSIEHKAKSKPSHKESISSPLKVKYWSCHLPIENQELIDLARRQVDVLQQAYKGNLTCDPEHQVYTPPRSDTMIRFEDFNDADITFITDERCSICEDSYTSLWEEYTPQEKGVLKVLLCKVETLLGVSVFPWEEPRGTMFDYRTLPGGGMDKYNEGKTMVHEFGHYFGLFHTFESACDRVNDRVADTNLEAAPFFGCPNVEKPPRSCEADLVDPVHNFLDYADDRCMCHFTAGQRDRLVGTMREYVYPAAQEA